MKKLILFLFLSSFVPLAVRAQSYETKFPLNNSPISENGKWISGSAAGSACPPGGITQCWADVRTNGSMAFGPQGLVIPTQFADATAVLTGTWNRNQFVRGVISIPGVTPSGCCHEVELRSRTTIAASSITGYEILFNVSAGQGYGLQVVRWNGGIGQFVYIGGNGGTIPQGVDSGSIVAITTGTNPTVIKVYINGVLATHAGGTQTMTACDNGGSGSGGSCDGFSYSGPGGAAGPWLSGSPGIGFYDTGDTNWNTFGLSEFQAYDTAGTIRTAVTASQADVNAQTSVAADGDIVYIPSGSPTWTSGITVPAGIGITVIGAGQVPVAAGAATCPAPGAGTCIQDSLTGNANLFKMTPTFLSSTSRVSSMTFVATQPTTGYDSPVSVSGTCNVANGCPNFRIDRTTMNGMWAGSGIADDSTVVLFNIFGVADHNLVGDTNTPRGGNGVNFINVAHGQWQGSGNFGDGAWASADTLGTSQMFYLEDNVFTNSFGTDSDRFGAAGGGGRVACRFNVFNSMTRGGVCSFHGTDTNGRTRGGLQWEAYYNTGTCTAGVGCSSPWPGRSGHGMSFGNTFTNVATGFVKRLASLDAQRRWRSDNPWGACDGSSPWDQNDTNGAGGNTAFSYYNGTVGTVTLLSGGASYNITDASNPGGFNPPNGAPYSMHDVTLVNQGAEIISSIAGSFVISVPDSTHGTHPAPGDSYQILRAKVCMDQPARGGGLVVTGPSSGLNPVLQSTGFPGSVNEILDPVYQAADTFVNPVGGTVNIDSATASIIANRDFFTETTNQGPQISPSNPFNGTSGTGHGTLANIPLCVSPLCLTGVGYWATNQGNWNQSLVPGSQGRLYVWNGSAWVLSWTPYVYPHPLISGSISGGGSAATPTFTPPQGTYGVTQNITLSDVTPSSTIFYCLDVTNSCTPSLTYSTPVVVSSSGFLRAFASASGLSNSNTVFAQYTIGLPIGNCVESLSLTSVVSALRASVPQQKYACKP